MTAESDLGRLLAAIDPELHEGVYVFATVASGTDVEAVATFEEREGRTVVVRREEAERAGIESAFPSAWITLRVHSSLAAVGFLARVTAHLAHAGIGCNAISAFHHDHLFVPHERGGEALELLRAIANEQESVVLLDEHGRPV